jgi:hypothetical protein
MAEVKVLMLVVPRKASHADALDACGMSLALDAMKVAAALQLPLTCICSSSSQCASSLRHSTCRSVVDAIAPASAVITALVDLDATVAVAVAAAAVTADAVTIIAVVTTTAASMAATTTAA